MNRDLVRKYTDYTAMILYGLGQGASTMLWYFVAVVILVQYGLPHTTLFTIIGAAGFMGSYFYHIRKYENIIRAKENQK